MFKVARLSVVSIMAVALSYGVAFSQTQGALNADACARVKQTDALLNKTYNQILKEYAKDAAFVRKLRLAQRAWIAYRDAQIEALYPEPDKLFAYGTVYPMCRCLALASLTTKRTDELKKWIDGIEEGDVCSGSTKKK